MKFNELYERLLESQQLEFNFNAPPKPERVYAKWMITCASRNLSKDALFKQYEKIQSMSHPQKKKVAYNCFMYAIKRRLKSRGLKKVHELTNQGLPEYIAASEYDFIPGIKCRKLVWHKESNNTNQQ